MLSSHSTKNPKWLLNTALLANTLKESVTSKFISVSFSYLRLPCLHKAWNQHSSFFNVNLFSSFPHPSLPNEKMITVDHSLLRKAFSLTISLYLLLGLPEDSRRRYADYPNLGQKLHFWTWSNDKKCLFQCLFLKSIFFTNACHILPSEYTFSSYNCCWRVFWTVPHKINALIISWYTPLLYLYIYIYTHKYTHSYTLSF